MRYGATELAASWIGRMSQLAADPAAQSGSPPFRPMWMLVFLSCTAVRWANLGGLSRTLLETLGITPLEGVEAYYTDCKHIYSWETERFVFQNPRINLI